MHDPEWLFDLKYDGFGALLYLEKGTRCRFISRNDNTLSGFDALCQTVAAALDVDDAENSDYSRKRRGATFFNTPQPAD